MIRQELNPETCRLEMKQRSRKLAGTSIQRPGSISQNVIAVFVGCRTMTFPAAPCTRLKTLALDLKRERTEGRKREKFYIYLDVTHTQQGRENPERQEEEKSGHTTGRRPKTAQGGEGNKRTSGTNLHGETDLTKTAHTPKPHDTLRRGTRGN